MESWKMFVLSLSFSKLKTRASYDLKIEPKRKTNGCSKGLGISPRQRLGDNGV